MLLSLTEVNDPRRSTRRKKTKVAALAFLCLASVPIAALENTPVVRVDAAGGQVFFKDFAGTSKTPVGTAAGSADWLFADGMKLSENDLLIPAVSGQYLRRDQVNQLGGGGTLVSQTLDDSASLRWVHSFGAWLIKPNIDYKNELAVSLPQDSIGKGLFDMSQFSAGLEAEWKGERVKSLRQTFAASKTDYYHYQTARSPLFGAELLLDGRNLNFLSYDYTLAADFVPWESALLSGSAGANFEDYAHQNVLQADPANPAGFLIVSKNRRDLLGTWLLSMTQRWSSSWGETPLETSAGLSAGYVVLSSNQNDFDAFQSAATSARFNSNFYSYHESSIGPLLSLTVAGKWKATASYTYARREYVARPVQDSLGSYLGGSVRTDTHAASISLSGQLSKHFSAQASGGYVYSSSNSHFESFYLYNYSYPYYFAGFGYTL